MYAQKRRLCFTLTSQNNRKYIFVTMFVVSSYTPDRTFRIFTHIRLFYCTNPIPTRGKDNNRTAARCKTSDVVAMIKMQDLIVVSKKKIIHNLCENGIEKKRHHTHRFVITRHNGDPWGTFFLFLARTHDRLLYSLFI